MWRVLRPGGIILSYDMRSLPPMGKSCRKLLQLMVSLFHGKGRLSGSSEEDTSTATRPLDIPEMQRLFPDGPMRWSTISLHFDFAGLARRSHLLTTLLSMLPVLRSHNLVIIRKPIYPV
jgi:hypothetical protein